jgi:hypothetical protein
MKADEMIRRTWGKYLLTLLVILFLVPGVTVGQDEPKSNERISKPDEVQTGRKKTRPPSQAVMKAEERPAPTPVNGKMLKMEDALKQPQQPTEGKQQPRIEQSQAENPKMGSGDQKARAAVAKKPVGSHLELVLKVTSDGTAEVVSAKEVPGEVVPVQNGPGEWVYAVMSGERTIAAQAIPDPFERRSFAPPPGSPLEGQGHHFERASTALVPVVVPNLTLRSPQISTLSLQLYRVKEGPPVLHVDPSVFQEFQKQQRLEMKIRIPAGTLNRQIRMRASGTSVTQ